MQLGQLKGGSAKTLLLVSTSTLEEMLRKGNVWYVRHYEQYFERVYVAYITGKPHEPVTVGKTSLVSLAFGRSNKTNIVLAAYRIYRLAREVRPTIYLTADLVYSWWTNRLVRFLIGARTYLMPVCIPEEIYKSSGLSMSSSLPIWLERLFVRLSFASADYIVAGRHTGKLADWLQSSRLPRRKLIVVDTIVDELPSNGFFRNLRARRGRDSRRIGKSGSFVLVYVGRLHKEKLVEDLVRMMAKTKELCDYGIQIRLNLIGEGPEKTRLERLARELGVERMIKFVGSIPNEDLPKHLLDADVFVSTLTGTALREAALCGLPIVAYNFDWIQGLLKHEETALLVRSGNYQGMASQVLRLVCDEKLRSRLSQNVRVLAEGLWSPEGLRESLSQAFGGWLD